MLIMLFYFKKRYSPVVILITKIKEVSQMAKIIKKSTLCIMVVLSLFTTAFTTQQANPTLNEEPISAFNIGSPIMRRN